MSLLYPSSYYARSAANMKGIATNADRFLVTKEGAALEAYEALKAEWTILPAEPCDLWDWCLEQNRSRLLDLLAYLTAHSVSAIQLRNLTGAKGGNAAERIARAVNLDMGQYWQTSEAFLARLPKAQIVQAVRESGIERAAQFADAIEKMKKGEAVTAAAEAMKGAAWLPAALQPQAIEDQEPEDEFEDDEDEDSDADEDLELVA